MVSAAINGHEYGFEDAGQEWVASWSPAGEPAPLGTPHGSQLPYV
jgi:hypothetical protein